MIKGKNRLLTFCLPVIGVLALLVAYQYGYLGLKAEVKSVRDEEISRARVLEKQINLIAGRPDLEKELAAAKERRKADNTKIIEAQTISLSAAALQDMVKGIITGRGGSITSERAEKPEELGNFKIVNVSIDAVVPDARALSDILFGIETRTPYLVVREIDTRVRNFKEPRELMIKVKVAALTGAGR